MAKIVIETPFDLHRRRNGELSSLAASVRVRVIPLAKALAENGHTVALRTSIIESRVGDSDLYVLSKILDLKNALSRLEELRANGTPLLTDFCDDHFHRHNWAIVSDLAISQSRVVTVNTESMRTKVLSRRISVKSTHEVPDQVEGKRVFPSIRPKTRQRAVWFGHPSNLDALWKWFVTLKSGAFRELCLITDLRSLTSKFYEILSSEDIPCTVSLQQWSIDAMAIISELYDVAVLPTVPDKPAKSNNRAAQAVWFGLPVLTNLSNDYPSLGPAVFARETINESFADLVTKGDVVERIVESQEVVSSYYGEIAVADAWLHATESLL